MLIIKKKSELFKSIIPIKDMKRILHIPEGTVNSRLNKGRLLLKQMLKE
jgi:hypothetical protein